MNRIQVVETVPAAPVRPGDAHKGSFGSVLIVAGSEGMSGAAILAGRAALHGGAGLVTVATPRSVYPIVAASHPSYMTLPLDDDDQGLLAESSLPEIQEKLPTQSVAAVGPGLGRSPGVTATVQGVYQGCRVPLVLDADGLNAFAGCAEKLSARDVDAARILTPHPGEFARLTGLDVSTIQANREAIAAEFAAKHNVVLLLKGPRTVITDGKRKALNSTGNSSLAKGGSGDVLTGLIASLIAQGMTAFEAAQLGAHLHGLAADCAVGSLAKQYITSNELLKHLNSAWIQYNA